MNAESLSNKEIVQIGSIFLVGIMCIIIICNFHIEVPRSSTETLAAERTSAEWYLTDCGNGLVQFKGDTKMPAFQGKCISQYLSDHPGLIAKWAVPVYSTENRPDTETRTYEILVYFEKTPNKGH